MEAPHVCQADKHDKEREALVPHILTSEKGMRNSGRLCDRVKIPGAITAEKDSSGYEILNRKTKSINSTVQ
ncbi:hypothetical protein Tco_0837789 [Tanacetum coccineum]